MLLSLILAVAPTLDGAPRIRMDQIGGAYSEFGGRFAIKPSLTGADEDRAGAFGFIDSRSGKSRDHSQGTFWVELLDGTTARLRTGRHVTFDVHGWSETISDGPLTATIRVSALARNVYRVRVALTGVSSPLTINGRIDGTVMTGATFSNAVVTIDDADRPPFGVALGGGALTGTSGATYGLVAAAALSADGTIDFTLAFDENPASAVQVLLAAPAEPPAVDWAAGLSSPRTTDAKYLATQERALAILRNGEVIAPDGGVLGGAAAKSHYNELWVWDSSFHALGVSEYDPVRAFAQLEGVFRGQVASGDEAGLLYNHVDESGQPVRLDVPGYTDEFSQAPAIGFAMRQVFDRSKRDDAAKAQLQHAFDVSMPYLDWWARRRDHDGDGLAEFNGGWESGWDNSPRWTEVWGDGLTARFAADDADPRPRLNCVDLNAWLYLYLVEMQRSAERLGRDDAAAWRDRADALAKKIDDAFWDDANGRYVDYTRAAGKQHFEKTNTAVTIWPLFAGSVRDLDRAKKVIEGRLLDPSRLWGAYGVPSVSFDDPAFASGDYWRGPVWINVSYAAMIALFRYGYEKEAEELKVKTLDLVASDHGIWEYYDAKSGAGINAYQFGWSGALFLEVLRDRHQAEAFAVGAARTGEIHRLMRLADGAVLAEVSVEGTDEVPVTQFEGAWDGTPVKMTFADPHGLIGDKTVTVKFPAYATAVALTGHVGDTVTLSNYQRHGCGCSAAGEPIVAALLVALSRVRRRRAS